MRKSVVWIGIGIILVGLVVYITASYLGDVAAGKYITGWEQDDPDLVLQYFVDERTADRIGTVGSVLLFLGIAFAFAGMVLETPPPPMTTYRDQHDPAQPPQQYPPEQPPPYPPQP